MRGGGIKREDGEQARRMSSIQKRCNQVDTHTHTEAASL